MERIEISDTFTSIKSLFMKNILVVASLLCLSLFLDMTLANSGRMISI